MVAFDLLSSELSLFSTNKGAWIATTVKTLLIGRGGGGES